MRNHAHLALALLLAPLTACLHSRQGNSTMPGGSPFNLAARCEYGAQQTSVLVTEWTVSDKADFEVLMGQGRGVAVAFSGCQMRVLPQCQLGGTYVWQRTTPGTDYVEIKNDADLYAKLPLGAATLSGELARSGELTVQTTVVGQKRLQGLTVAQVPNDQECAEATHIVNAVSLGAFVMTAGRKDEASASASATLGELGARGSRSADVLRAAGDAATCGASGSDAPPENCASPIQVFLTPIPGRAEPVGPPGTVKIDFESADASTRWDVYIDDQATCTTPCAGWFDPTRPVVLRTRDLPEKLRLDQLDPTLGPLQVTAAPTAQGELVTGLTFTAFGGMGDVTGIALGAVGCFGGRAGLCNAGLVTLGASSVVTAGAIWLMLDAAPRAFVRPLFGNEASASLDVGPGFVHGRF